MGKIYNDPDTGEIFVEKNDGSLAWSSDYPPVNLLPESDWIEDDLTVAFPDFSKFVNYGHARWNITPTYNPVEGEWTPGESGDTCTSVTMIEPENRVLSAVDLGTVPSGANYIDVRVRLNQTNAPYDFRDQSVPSLIPNEWVSLPGGSCLVEATAIWRRSFDIVLSGQTVQLIRRQSVIDLASIGITPTNGFWPPGIYDNTWPLHAGGGSVGDGLRDPWGQQSYKRWGWISGGDFAGSHRAGHPAALIQAKDYSVNSGHDSPSFGAKHPVRSNACSTNNSAHDFSSTYSGQIVIRPGYIPS